jgi:cell division protein FtsI (penicillin-binding protein 3)
MSYGHGISVSLMQMARAYRCSPATASDPGTMLRARPGGRVPVFRPETAHAVLQMLEMAAAGQPHRSRRSRLPVGGKTGTAHKQERRLPEQYIASFVGSRRCRTRGESSR